MKKDLLNKYFSKEADSKEREEVLNWIKKNPENQKKYNLLKAQYVANTLKQVKDTSNEVTFSAFKKKQGKKRQSRYMLYAAVVVLLISTGFFLYQNQSGSTQNEILKTDSGSLIAYTENGAKKEVVLPDGSTVQLNIDSRLEYPDVFKGDIRTVTLIGEGLFDVVHDSSRPFIVKTQDFDVRVLGTSFNVKSYLNDSQTETTLITGKVELLRKQEKSIVLAPSQKAVFHKTKKKIEVEKVISEDVIAWQNGTLVFKRTPMQQVALDLERKHNVKIIINSPKLLTYEYTGTFDNLTLEESLQLLMISSPIKYKINDKQIIIDMEE